MDIRKIPTNWRDKYQQAQFRWAIFFVETDARQGGRRVALHQYPKRNIPYAEDMGRAANKFTVQGYLIGKFGGSNDEEVNYLTLKNNLIDCLEQDGPGVLKLPLPYKGSDVTVMVMSYSVTESRERGGMCLVEMEFIEYGNPSYRPTPSTPARIDQSANAVESAVTAEPMPTTPADIVPYVDIYRGADVQTAPPTLAPSPTFTVVSGGFN